MRIFVAIDITDQMVTNSIKKFQDELEIDARPIKSQNFHFTLQFLGEVSQDSVEKIRDALQSVEFSSFDIMLKGVGVFPKPSFPRIIWVGTDEKGGETLVDLSKKVVKVLEPLGFIQDKPFKPHITVFRIKKKIGDISEELESKKMINFGIQKISNIKLKKSELTSSGPIYTDLLEVCAIK
ncbi:MAG: RNA 2',3'-cyclic phosphodiesterase [Nitrosopumilus sp.]|nr:RNA 2',3'-cyclic phosphodiesterase [Nitrosopumilus sp.]NNL37713.1 RNA 2',3'-cyclic phosphodiesterase [Nitrosopumilus sp.]